MRRLTLLALVLPFLFGCAVYKDKEGHTHMEFLPPPAAVYVGPPAYYYPPAPYYGPYYYGPYYGPYGYYWR